MKLRDQTQGPWNVEVTELFELAYFKRAIKNPIALLMLDSLYDSLCDAITLYVPRCPLESRQSDRGLGHEKNRAFQP